MSVFKIKSNIINCAKSQKLFGAKLSATEDNLQKGEWHGNIDKIFLVCWQ